MFLNVRHFHSLVKFHSQIVWRITTTENGSADKSDSYLHNKCRSAGDDVGQYVLKDVANNLNSFYFDICIADLF